MQDSEKQEQNVLPVLVQIQMGPGIIHEGQPSGGGSVLLAVPIHDDEVCVHEVILAISRNLDNAAKLAMVALGHAAERAQQQQEGGQEGEGDAKANLVA